MVALKMNLVSMKKNGTWNVGMYLQMLRDDNKDIYNKEWFTVDENF